MKKQTRQKRVSEETPEYLFIDKAVFFPKQEILAIGDLHLGFEHMLRRTAVGLPESQTEETIKNLKEIFSKLKAKGYKIKKIVFLGDIKHYFGFQYKEMKYFDAILDFLKKRFKESDIILIKGNHDKMDYSGKRMKNYYINGGICFTHGHMEFPQIYSEKVQTIVLGHIHPSVILSEKKGVKREKFKCFLVGKLYGKNLIILPSFFNIIEGASVNDYKEDYNKYFSIVPKTEILNSEIFVIGKDKVYDFGKVRDLD